MRTLLAIVAILFSVGLAECLGEARGAHAMRSCITAARALDEGNGGWGGSFAKLAEDECLAGDKP
jgi:hypothetical protein